MDISGKVALVTGAGSGIGRAVAADLAQRGVGTIVLVDRSDCINQLAPMFIGRAAQEVSAVPFVGDVSDDAFRRHVFDTVVEKYGVPRICIPAAGIARDGLSAKLNKDTGQAELYPIENFRLTLEVDLIAPIYWALEMVGRIAEDRHARGQGRWDPSEHIQGTIIFIGSVSSQGNRGQLSYSAAKAGLQGATATLMKEAIFHGVRCGLIHPGFTDTPMVRSLGESYIQDRILPFTQLRRLIRPQEVSDAICFMIQNSAVSGELWTDAGWHPSA